jgi:hypothetical protein
VVYPHAHTPIYGAGTRAMRLILGLTSRDKVPSLSMGAPLQFPPPSTKQDGYIIYPFRKIKYAAAK